MQIEKHIKIVPTPTGAVVFFAGQVCLTITEGEGQFAWSISPVFAKLTIGASTFRDIPFSWTTHSTLAEAVADGLTRLDEMQAFYGVIDMPEDTYVGEHLVEEVNEVADYSGIHGDVKRTGKSHEQLAADHRTYAKEMRRVGADGLARNSEFLAKKHDEYIASLKKTNESLNEALAESFVVRNSEPTRTSPARAMVSAEAVIKRARELAKEAGELKNHHKFIKVAHAEFASRLSEEELIDEGSGSKEKQRTPYRDINSPEYKAKADYQRQRIAKDKAAEAGKKLLNKKVSEEFVQYEDALPWAFHDMRAKLHKDYLSGANEEFEGDQIEEGLVDNIKRGVKNIKRARDGWGKETSAPGGTYGKDEFSPKNIVARNKAYPDEKVAALHRSFDRTKVLPHSPSGLQKRVLDREMKKRGLSEEFIQYGDALPWAFQSIKEDCRAEALTMTNSLLEAQQLANELFEDIVEEYLNELSKGTLGSYIKKAAVKAAFHSGEARGSDNGDVYKKNNKTVFKRLIGVSKATDKLTKEEVELDEVILEAGNKPLYKSWTGADTRTPRELKTHMRNASDEFVNHNAKDNGIFLDKVAKMQSKLAKSELRKRLNNEEVEELDEGKILDIEAKIKKHDSSKTAGMSPADLFSHENIRKQLLAKRKTAQRDYNKRLNNEEVELDEAALSGDAYWKSKEAESKEEFLKSQRKALGLPEPVKRGRGKPTLIDRDSLKGRAHDNIKSGKRPTDGFDRNEKIHFVRHLKNHPDFADHHVSKAGRPTGTTNTAKQEKEVKKKQETSAFSMWAGLGKR